MVSFLANLLRQRQLSPLSLCCFQLRVPAGVGPGHCLSRPHTCDRLAQVQTPSWWLWSLCSLALASRRAGKEKRQRLPWPLACSPRLPLDSLTSLGLNSSGFLQASRPWGCAPSTGYPAAPTCAPYSCRLLQSQHGQRQQHAPRSLPVWGRTSTVAPPRPPHAARGLRTPAWGRGMHGEVQLFPRTAAVAAARAARAPRTMLLPGSRRPASLSGAYGNSLDAVSTTGVSWVPVAWETAPGLCQASVCCVPLTRGKEPRFPAVPPVGMAFCLLPATASWSV